MAKKLRVLVAKPGLDGHDRGAKVVARALRDAGFEVVYTGLHQTPEMIAEAAVQEDVDVVGVSIMTSGQLHIAENLIPKLKAADMDDVLVIFGGTIPPVDFETLEKLGVHRTFPAGLPGGVVADFIRENVGKLSLA